MKFGIRIKMFIVLIPLLIGSFSVAGYVSVSISRLELLKVASGFIGYKLEQLEKYTNSQWRNFEESDLSDNAVYRDVVQRSIEAYAREMISSETESIFAVSDRGTLLFSTHDIGYTLGDWPTIESPSKTIVGGLQEYEISGTRYFGQSTAVKYNGARIFVVEPVEAVVRNIRSMIFIQLVTFGASLGAIIISVIVSLSYIINPIRRISQSARQIAQDIDLTRTIRVEHSDEVGQLAYDFNNMTSNLDLSIRKLKKKALDEAIAKKNVLEREIETLEVLGKASNYKDAATGAHIIRVSKYSLLLSQMLGLSQELQELIYRASPLHDIGKLGISDSILLKPGPLSEEEFDIIKTHTTIGYEIIRNPSSGYLKAGAVIALSHHEKFDGTGYPYGLEGENIPIFGRIVSIADVFDAVTTKRPYKEAWSFDDAVDLVKKNRGNHFDPQLVDLFSGNLGEFRRIYDDTFTS